MSRATMMAICAAALVFSVVPSGMISTAMAEISVETQRHSEGDWFTYDGYGLSLANSMSIIYNSNISSGFVGWTLGYDEPLRIDVIERGTCDFGEWAGSCMRSQATHSLNITLEWTTNTTPYDDDKMILNISTTIQHEEPLATSAWERESRTISISAWFLGDDELNLVETETKTLSTTQSSAERPLIMEIGDTWQATLETHKEDTIRQRINRGMWNETISSFTESRQILYTVEEESTVHTAKLDWSTLRLREQAVGEENYSIVYLSEFGWQVRTEEYESGVVVMSTTLTDFFSSQYDGPKITTIEQTPAPSIFATMATIFLAAVIFVCRSPADGA
jgi:hypothetical protein